MELLETTYKTLSGTKKVVELAKKKYHQHLIYQDNKPKYFVDFYDLEKESNAKMNSLVLCTNKSLNEVLEIINTRNNINLSVPKTSNFLFKRKVKSKEIKIDLQPIPEEWLSYSL